MGNWNFNLLMNKWTFSIWWLVKKKEKKKDITLSEHSLVCLAILRIVPVFRYSCIIFLFWPMCPDFSTAGGVQPQNPRAARFSKRSTDLVLGVQEMNLVNQQKTSKLLLSELNRRRPDQDFISFFGTDICFSLWTPFRWHPLHCAAILCSPVYLPLEVLEDRNAYLSSCRAPGTW